MRNAGCGMRNKDRRIVRQVASFLLMMTCFLSPVLAEEKWSGVDKTVVEKYAIEHGMETRAPLINMDQGDLLLFVFLLAGAVGGFAAGYSWRMLTERKRGDEPCAVGEKKRKS